jgi:hypothetical protein
LNDTSPGHAANLTAEIATAEVEVRGALDALMVDLLGPDGEPLHDSEGNALKEGQMVRDDMFGDGTTRGTIPLDRSEGVNVLIDWRHPAKPGDPPKPRSRGALHLTIAGGTATGRVHSGDDFESGALHPGADTVKGQLWNVVSMLAAADIHEEVEQMI